MVDRLSRALDVVFPRRVEKRQRRVNTEITQAQSMSTEELRAHIMELNKTRTPVIIEEGGAFSGPGPFLEDR